jgi:hypothetical protein
MLKLLRRWRLGAPLLLIVALIGARLTAVPALSDPVHGAAPASLHLHVPVPYLLFSPAFTLWDSISMLSMSRLWGFLQGLGVLYLLWRLGCLWARTRDPRANKGRLVQNEVVTLILTLAGLLLFLATAALWHRPMLSLAGVPSGQSVVDFHSHSNLSHDVKGTLMAGFSAAANRRWHARAGFDAVFLTDHDMVSQESRVASRESKGVAEVPALCPGIEVSAWRAHIVLLGDTLALDRNGYRRSLDGLLTLLRTSESKYHALSLASLPEYRRNHWGRLGELITAGLDGFEIVNAAPKANELSRAERDSVITLARARNRFLVGVSDSHGWGATSMVWNLVPVSRQPEALCERVLDRLRSGFPAVQIVERHRVRPDDRWPMLLTPIGVLWETWRSMGGALTLSWLGWILVWLAWRAGRAALAKG